MRFLAAVLACFVLPVWAFDYAPLMPTTAGTVTITCPAAGNTTALAKSVASTDAFNLQSGQLEVTNAGTVVIFVEPGVSGVTALVASGYPVLPGQTKVITVTTTVTHIGCISGSGNQTTYVTVGRGY
jgi:hypothetical protein